MCSLLAALALPAWTGASWAQQAPPTTAPDEPPTADNVAEVRVVGNEQISTNAVLAAVRTRAGQPYVERVAIEDQRRLLDTGHFADVQITSARTDQGVVVTIRVVEHERIASLAFQGNRHFSDRQLRSAITLEAPGPLDRNRIEAARTTLLEKYQGASFYFVGVSVDEEALTAGRLVFRVTEGPRIRVRGIRFLFDGPRSFSRFKLRRQIKTRMGIWLLSRGKLQAGQLTRDAVDLESFYRDRGYLDVEVTPELRFSPDKRLAYVYFLIREGPRYRIAEIEFQGNEVFSDQELRRRLRMVEGKPYEALQLHRDTEALKQTYGEIGHVDAQAEPALIYLSQDAPLPDWAKAVDGPAPGLVRLRYRLTEGEPYRVRRITIRGNDVTRERVIRRQLRLFPGQLFNAAAAEESRKRLRETGLFSDVKINPFGQEPGWRDALVSVEETETARFGIGFGVSSNSGLVGTLNFIQQNFGWSDPPESLEDFFTGQSFKGEGQVLRMDLEAGTELANARINWREPYLFDRPVSLGVGAFAVDRQRDNYDEGRLGAHASLGRLFPNRWYGELAVQPESIEISDLDDDAPPEVRSDAGHSFLTSFAGTLVRDRTDSRWMPSKGDRLSLSYRQFVGDYVFAKASADYSRYFTVHVDSLDRKHILAAHGELGSIIGGDSPVFERYYGGGLGNIRGFRFRGISPRSAGPVGRGEPVGGDMLVYVGTEYTFPLVGETLRGAVFVDSGTVEQGWEVTTWRVSAGVGIRVHMDFFQDIPMSLDLGFPIVKNDDDDTQLVSFSVGWLF